MTIQAKILAAIAASGLAAFAVTSQAHALTAQECSAKYQAAKTAGTLGGQKWNDFRKAQCGADAAAAPAAAAPAAAPKEAKKEAAPKEAAKKEAARRSAVRPRGLSDRRGSEIRQGDRRQGPHAHLRRSVQRQQGHQCQWWVEVDPEGRRLLQRMLEEAERLRLTLQPGAAGCFGRA